jgi:gluconolactonase
MLRTTALLLVLSLPQLCIAQGSESTGIPKVIAPKTTVKLVKEGFVFTEGPVGRSDGGINFSDLRASRIYRLDQSGKITIFRENTRGANGLALDRNDNLLAAEGDGRRIVRMDSHGKVTPIAVLSVKNELFLAPNDLIVDRRGGIYFTDPGPRPVVPGRKAYVYYFAPDGDRPVAVDDEIVRPNGLTLTTDGNTLIVDDTLGETVFAFSVESNGSVKDKRPFAHLHDIPPGQESGADGMALDRDDRIYVTTVTGVQVFDKAGQYLGTIRVPRQPANLAFAGPNKRTLYITAREGLYKLQMLSQGPDRPGK